jgi:hypothetical protein
MTTNEAGETPVPITARVTAVGVVFPVNVTTPLSLLVAVGVYKILTGTDAPLGIPSE